MRPRSSSRASVTVTVYYEVEAEEVPGTVCHGQSITHHLLSVFAKRLKLFNGPRHV